jgi:hypothetical protein
LASTLRLEQRTICDLTWHVLLFGDEVKSIHEFDPLTGHETDELVQPYLVEAYKDGTNEEARSDG